MLWSALVLLVAARSVPAQSQFRSRIVEPIGVLGIEGSGALGIVASVAVSRDGRTFVLDREDRNIKVFDRAGTVVTSIGRRGAGPGEMRTPIAVQFAGDTLVVRDQANGDLLFDHAGKFLRVQRPWPGFDRRVLRAGHALLTSVPDVADRREAGSAAANQLQTQLAVLVRPNGRADTLLTIARDVGTWVIEGRPATARPTGFGNSGAISVVGDSLVFLADGYAGSIRAYRIDQSGVRLVRTWSLPGQVARVTPSDVRTQERAFQIPPGVGGWTSNGQGQAERTAPVGTTPATGRFTSHPTLWSRITTLHFDPVQNTLWVGAPRRHAPYANDGGRLVWGKRSIADNRWTALPLNGEPFIIELPSDVSLAAVNDGRLMTLPLNDEEVEIRLFRVR
jgi:hypothetical protein